MKRAALSAALLLALLCGCSGREAAGERLARELSENGFTGEGVLAQTSGDYWNEYGVRVEYAGGESVFTLTAPEAHAGITARVRRSETAVAFDGTELVLPGPEAQISVFAVLHDALFALGEAPISAVGAETLDGRDCAVLCYDHRVAGQTVSHRVWIDRDTGKPVRAESAFGTNAQTFRVTG